MQIGFAKLQSHIRYVPSPAVAEPHTSQPIRSSLLLNQCGGGTYRVYARGAGGKFLVGM